MTLSIPTRSLGKNAAATFGAIGFGGMGLAHQHGTGAEQDTVNTLLDECIKRRQLGYNERQFGAYFASRPGAREKVFLATKFGHYFLPEGASGGIAGHGGIAERGDHDYVLQACNDSLHRLGVDHIDLYYSHRAAPNADVTETVGAMKLLKEQGKIHYIGVSEYNIDQLKRANAVVHIDAVQIEVSPWTPDVLTNGIATWCHENGTALIAYSPLGRGFLTGQYKSVEDFEAGDMRRGNPRFQGENFKKNLQLVQEIKAVADKKSATPGQIALAWLLSKNIIPIPGTKKLPYLIENAEAGHISLTEDEVDEIDSIIKSFDVSGTRYPEARLKTLAF